MAANNLVLVFVHGWSVSNLDTYGQLPLRLQAELNKIDNNAQVKNIYLGQYISFHDEVRLHDISRAFETAVNEQLADVLASQNRFICITHSTGGPVIREWWDTYYNSPEMICPMSHLIMLAPANFGSALAQLGKAKISRLKSWFQGVEPGQGILNWLELGSDESWLLNEKWIKSDGNEIGEKGIFPFVIIGQSIDRAFYDNLNAYTGELGSDGVVRSAAANLNASYVNVKQGSIQYVNNAYVTQQLSVEYQQAPSTAFKIVKGKSHSDKSMGIMASPKEDANEDNQNSADLVNSILRCIKVNDLAGYQTLTQNFDTETAIVQVAEQLETVGFPTFIFNRHFIHDRFSMVIFRVRDAEGYPVTDYDLIFTAGELDSPNHLPEGFFCDRQQNSLSPETVTYFINYEIMNGCNAVVYNGKEIRPALAGIDTLGITFNPRPDNGFVRYMPFKIHANKAFFDNVIKPNSTTLIDICLQRLVSTEVFRLIPQSGSMPVDEDFSKITPGEDVVK